MGPGGRRDSPLRALEDVRRVLPGARPNPLFLEVLRDAETGDDRFGSIATPSAAK
jgi:ADP-ribosyl-[dinitrogen reductase] hydrolase